MIALGTFLAYEAVWLAAVAGAGRGLTWPGLAAAAVFIGWRMGLARRRAVEIRLLVAALLIGAVLETCWVRSGLIAYAAAGTLAPVPLWLLALWASFGLTIVPLFGYLHGRPWLAAVLGALGGPLSYSAAARGWQAVIFPAKPQATLLALALGWAVALALLTGLARRWLMAGAADGAA